jgi:hypothetical protein
VKVIPAPLEKPVTNTLVAPDVGIEQEARFPVRPHRKTLRKHDEQVLRLRLFHPAVGRRRLLGRTARAMEEKDDRSRVIGGRAGWREDDELPVVVVESQRSRMLAGREKLVEIGHRMLGAASPEKEPKQEECRKNEAKHPVLGDVPRRRKVTAAEPVLGRCANLASP